MKYACCSVCSPSTCADCGTCVCYRLAGNAELVARIAELRAIVRELEKRNERLSLGTTEARRVLSEPGIKVRERVRAALYVLPETP